ncbi:LuxR C-terminal-related transcriptional regulator [Streptomyces sp. NPDC048248]|uniref:helix-turn-helix transcriptional regulator n=1 Tax=Streptomyces sp. NPDC048248 TaxID=3365523 RepID=UPI00371AE8C3
MTRVMFAMDDSPERSRLYGRFTEAHGVTVVAMCGIREALGQLETHRPEVVLAGAPGARRSPGWTESGRRLADRVPLGVFTDDPVTETTAQARSAGASGFLDFAMSGGELGLAARLLASGHVVVAPRARKATDVPEVARATTTVPAHPHPSDRPDTSPRLSPREREVLRLMTAGLTNVRIAETLHLSPTTVKTHVSTILRKLGVTNRVQAVMRQH